MKEIRNRLMRTGMAVMAVLSFASMAKANPYASGVSNNVPSAGSVSFILNEPAGDVYVVYGANAATNDLGALTKGPQSFSLTYNSVTYTSYKIYVANVGNGAF